MWFQNNIIISGHAIRDCVLMVQHDSHHGNGYLEWYLTISHTSISINAIFKKLDLSHLSIIGIRHQFIQLECHRETETLLEMMLG